MTESFFIKIVEGYLLAARYSNPEECCLMEDYSQVSDELFDKTYEELSEFWDKVKDHKLFKKGGVRPSLIGEAIWMARNFKGMGLFIDYPMLRKQAEEMGMRFASKTPPPHNLLVLS